MNLPKRSINISDRASKIFLSILREATENYPHLGVGWTTNNCHQQHQHQSGAGKRETTRRARSDISLFINRLVLKGLSHKWRFNGRLWLGANPTNLNSFIRLVIADVEAEKKFHYELLEIERAGKKEFFDCFVRFPFFSRVSTFSSTWPAQLHNHRFPFYPLPRPFLSLFANRLSFIFNSRI